MAERSRWSGTNGCVTLPAPHDPLLLATVTRAEEGWHAWIDQSSPGGPRFPVWTGRTYADARRAKLACRCALGWMFRRMRAGVGQPVGLFRLHPSRSLRL